MTAKRVAVPIVAIVLATATPAFAQSLLPDDPTRTGGTTVHLVPGIVFTRAVFGDDAPKRTSAFGISLGGKLCYRGDGPTAFVAEATLIPLPIRNPHFDERLRPLHLQAGAQWGRGTYFRLTGGIAVQFWSEPKRRYRDIALSFSAAVGHETRVGSSNVAPEAVVRLTAAPGIGTMSIGAQTVIGTCGQR